jgi:hypothetical protein
MVTADEQRALQLENAKADESFWTSLHDMAKGTAEGHRGLAASVQSALAADEAAMADAMKRRAEARERIERIKRGEDVAGGLKPRTYDDWLKALGWNASDARHAELLNEMRKLGLWEPFLKEFHNSSKASEKARARAAARAVLRQEKDPS